MSDTSQGPGWWLASDGRWYPPESHPNAAPPPPPPAPPRTSARQGFQPLKKSTAQWTQGAMWVVALAQGVQAIAGYLYWNAFNEWQRGDRRLNQALSFENAYYAIVNVNRFVWLGGFVFLVIWLANVHSTTTSLLPEGQGRQYTRGWSIGVWFIPLVNLIATPLVIAENQRIAFTTRSKTTVAESWTSTPVKAELIWWWLLVAAGLITFGVGGRMMADDFAPTRDFLTGLTAVIAGSTLTTFGVAIGASFVTEMNERLIE